jgi:hypothetical protein
MTPLSVDDDALLAEICRQYDVPQVVLVQLIDLEQDLFGMGRRHGLYEKIGDILEKAIAKEE